MRVTRNVALGELYAWIILTPADGKPLPDIYPGQFVQVEIAQSKNTYLRRPISINYVDKANYTLWLLVRKAGDGTRALASVEDGDTINMILPLGHGFDLSADTNRPLLVGGGVGVAPLLYLGKCFADKGVRPAFLLGARTKQDLLLLDEFSRIGDVYISTEDGSLGEKGLVTNHNVLGEDFDKIYCCGPMPMMKAVARIASARQIECEVSLENKMACGLGACLCCVEKDSNNHNVCVCTDGPVFNIKDLQW